MKSSNCDKMIFAILRNTDYREVIENLNKHGFYVTVLNSSGGFLKEPNATIMIGLNHQYLDEAVELLKQYGSHTEMEFKPASSSMGMAVPPIPITSVPVPVSRGGVVLFVVDVADYQKY